MSFRIPLAIVLTACSLTACSAVSPQTVTLSEVVSDRVTAMQASHEAFVRGYFGQSRKRIEDFLIEQWIPHFLEHFVNNASGDGENLLHLLETATPFEDDEIDRLRAAFKERGVNDPSASLAAVEDAFGGGEQGKVVLEFSKAAMAQIELKRKALLDPLEDLERQALQKLLTAYAQIQQAQDSVTSHLRSLADEQAEQDQVLQRVHLLEKRDQFLQRAIAVNESVTSVLEAGEGIDRTLTTLEKALRTETTAGSSGQNEQGDPQ